MSDKNVFGTIPAAEFRKLITRSFAPEIRKLGFAGSGNNYRRLTDDHYIHAIQLFPSKWGDSVYIEAGVSIDFLPDSCHQMIDPKKVKVIDCEIRKCLLREDGQQSYSYGGTSEEAIVTIGRMVEDVRTYGMAYFERFRAFPEPLVSLTVDDLREDPPPGVREIFSNIFTGSLLLARLHLWLGDQERASAFADHGLAMVDGMRGSGLVPFFERVKRGDRNFAMTAEDKERLRREQAELEEKIFGKDSDSGTG